MCRTGQLASAADAASAVTAGLSWLAAADMTELTTAEQADCLRALERAESQTVAARSAVLAAFDAGRGFEDDAAGGCRSWLRRQTRVTTAAAAGAVGWMRRLAAHPAVAASLADGGISASWARHVTDWSDRLPIGTRADADEILLAAAAAGAELNDLGGLAEEMFRRRAPADSDGQDDGFRDRSVRLAAHFRGAGRLDGNLTPECTTALRAVLDALGARAGTEDYRTQQQRDHDALFEACRRLVASGCLPDRAGQATKIQLHMTLEQLLGLDGAGQAAAEWAGHGAAAPPGADCDASIVPIVTGHVNAEMLDQLAAALLTVSPASGIGTGQMAATAARELILSRATRLLSGPSGLAAWRRTGLTPGPAASISLPLDVGAATETIPAHLRRAIILRDKHCGFPGCAQPPAACQVHHLIPRSEGGTTSLDNCGLFCTFHHLIAIHRWGWTVTLNPDGTKTATSPSGDRTLHSHSPPGRAA